MKHSATQSDKNLKPHLLPSWLVWAFIIISFLGFLDATYLTIAHYTGAELNCSFLDGCGTVTTSQYALILGIPVALLGTLFYLSMLILSLLYFDTRNEKVLWLMKYLPFTGLLASAYFVYLQFFVIKALCQYCMLSAVTSTLLFVLALTAIIKSKPKA